MTKLWPPPLDPASEAFAQEQDRFVRRYACLLLATFLLSVLMGLSVGGTESVQALKVAHSH